MLGKIAKYVLNCFASVHDKSKGGLKLQSYMVLCTLTANKYSATDFDLEARMGQSFSVS